MQYSKSGLAKTKEFEECRLTAYKDRGGVLTIGFGHTHGVYEGQTCTRYQAEVWLLADIQWAVAVVNNWVHVELNQDEFDALVDFVFNVGAGAFTKSTLLRDLNEGRYADAARQFPLWDHVHGRVVAGLLKRRLVEQKEFEEGMEEQHYRNDSST